MPVQAKIKGALATLAVAPTYKAADVPDLGIYSTADKVKAGLRADATDADYIRHAFAPFNRPKDYVSTLVGNIPRGALQLAASPAAIAQLAGNDLGQGVVRGNWTPLKTDAREIAREQYAFGKGLVQHPAGTLEHDPVSTVATFSGVGKLLGAAGGVAARSAALDAAGGLGGERGAAAAAAVKRFATPAERTVVPAGYHDVETNGTAVPPPAISRGLSSPNLYDRTAQAAHDWLAQHVPIVGSRVVKRATLDTTRNLSRIEAERRRLNVEPALNVVGGLNGSEQRAAPLRPRSGRQAERARDVLREPSRDAPHARGGRDSGREEQRGDLEGHPA